MADVKEPATGKMLPASLSFPSSSTSLKLIGVGCREKKVAFIGVKVYAVALYAEPTAAASELEAFKGKDAAALEKDETFYGAIRSGNFGKAISIVLARDIATDSFVGGLKDSLQPRLKPEDTPALDSFKAAFTGVELKNNTRIHLSLTPPATVTVTIDTKGSTEIPADAKTTTVEGAGLLAGLADVYLGKDPVAPSLKKSVAELSRALF